MDWYSQFQGKDMPSPFAVKKTLENFDNLDIVRLRSFHQIGWDHDGRNASKKGQDIRLFTTHNGRVGITSCEIMPGDTVACFPVCDIAVVVDAISGKVEGRAFILKSDRRTSRGLGLSSADAAAFRFAVPDVIDDEIYSFRSADVDNFGRPTVRDLEARGRSLTLTLEEWQSLTW